MIESWNHFAKRASDPECDWLLPIRAQSTISHFSVNSHYLRRCLIESISQRRFATKCFIQTRLPKFVGGISKPPEWLEVVPEIASGLNDPLLANLDEGQRAAVTLAERLEATLYSLMTELALLLPNEEASL